MRWLESAPDRYDAGMRALTFGRVERLHEAVALAADAGGPVLEIGCGTGAVTARMTARGLDVTAVDQSPEMIERARERLAQGTVGDVTFIEQTAAETDRFDPESFAVVVASLVFSDMSPSERSFVLEHAHRVLRAEGRLVIADEVRPRGRLSGVLFRLIRAPQALLTWLVTGAVSRPVEGLRDSIEQAGFRVIATEHWLGGSLEMVVAEKSA